MSEADTPAGSPENGNEHADETEHSHEHEHEHGEEHEHDFPLPPATFEFFVLSLKYQAEMSMGLVHFGEEKDRPKPDLRVARHTIDLLAMLQEKTKGNLSYEEQRLIENAVTELKFRFVQVSESQSRKS